jgi:hypothetical protein
VLAALGQIFVNEIVFHSKVAHLLFPRDPEMTVKTHCSKEVAKLRADMNQLQGSAGFLQAVVRRDQQPDAGRVDHTDRGQIDHQLLFTRREPFFKQVPDARHSQGDDILLKLKYPSVVYNDCRLIHIFLFP